MGGWFHLLFHKVEPNMKTINKQLSPVVTALLLIIIILSGSMIIYSWLMKYSSSFNENTVLPEMIKIESVDVDGKLLTLYVRNIGENDILIDSLYLISREGVVKKLDVKTGLSSSITEIWGGDTWRVHKETFVITLESTGKILYDTFTSSNPAIWNKDYVDHNNAWSSIYYDPDGLKLLSQSNGGWAVRGSYNPRQIHRSSGITNYYRG